MIISNEGWYPHTHEYDHMRAFSSFRAVETARSFVRVTNTGISMLLDPRGRELATVRGPSGDDRDVAGWMYVRPPLSDEHTFYAQWGFWLGPLCAVASGVVLLMRLGMGISRRRRAKAA